MPMSVKTRISVAHSAIASGLANATATLVVTALSTPCGRSSNIGIATTLLANMGAASTLPSSSQVSKRWPCSSSTTTRRKSSGLFTGAAAKRVMSAADVNTQPVPASASRPPKSTSRWSCGRQAASAVASVARWPRSSAWLTAYRPVATSGATSMKPLKLPASSQKWSRAATSSSAPKSAAAAPCSRPGSGQRNRSAQPRASQTQGRPGGTALMCKPVAGGVAVGCGIGGGCGGTAGV